MAQHFIYDSKGRVTEIQNDEEYYRSHGRFGCFNNVGTAIVFIILIVAVIIASLSGNEEGVSDKE